MLKLIILLLVTNCYTLYLLNNVNSVVNRLYSEEIWVTIKLDNSLLTMKGKIEK